MQKNFPDLTLSRFKKKKKRGIQNSWEFQPKEPKRVFVSILKTQNNHG